MQHWTEPAVPPSLSVSLSLSLSLSLFLSLPRYIGLRICVTYLLKGIRVARTRKTLPERERAIDRETHREREKERERKRPRE